MTSAWVLAALLAHGGTLVDRVVAVVDKDVITENELFTEARVALAWRQGERAASADLDEELVLALRDYVINQTLVAGQARRLGVTDVSAEDLERRAWQFRQRFTSNTSYAAFLRRFGIPEATALEILRRDLQNERAVDQRMRTRLTGGHQTPEGYSEALKSWLEELRQGVEVRLIGPTGELEPVTR